MGTLKFLISVLHFLFFFGIFSYLHGLIRTYTFIYFREKFPPTWLCHICNTLKFLISVLYFLFFFGIFSYLHGLIRTYTFIYFREKFPPTRLLRTTCLFIFEANSQLSTYTIIHFNLNLLVKKDLILGIMKG